MRKKLFTRYDINLQYDTKYYDFKMHNLVPNDLIHCIDNVSFNGYRSIHDGEVDITPTHYPFSYSTEWVKTLYAYYIVTNKDYINLASIYKNRPIRRDTMDAFNTELDKIVKNIRYSFYTMLSRARVKNIKGVYKCCLTYDNGDICSVPILPDSLTDLKNIAKYFKKRKE